MITATAPALWNASDVAQVLGVDVDTFDTLVQQGHAPQPVQGEHGQRWRRDEVRAWIRAECPESWNWTPPTTDADAAADRVEQAFADLDDAHRRLRELRDRCIGIASPPISRADGELLDYLCATVADVVRDLDEARAHLAVGKVTP